MTVVIGVTESGITRINGEINFLLNFEINEDKKDNLVNLTLIPEEQGEAEFFCTTFLKALKCGEAGFNPTANGIIFFNEKCPFQPAEITFQLDGIKQRKLQEFFEAKRLAVIDMRPKKIGIQIFQYKKS
jgi:hypothetical protein